MAHLTLFRKWRPQLLSEVVGQEHITRTLKNALEEKAIANAYLFSGPRGTGKTSVARILAKAINCEKGITSEPCNKCASCLSIINGNSMDVYEIDGASQRKVEDTRELRKEVFLAPGAGRYKVYIIDEVHMLTEESFNTLLKVLEEPPDRTVFILATTEIHKIIPTIVSRCQKYDFRRISQKNIVEHLKEVAKKEKIKIDEIALFLIAKHAQGSLRDGLVFLDQLSTFSKKKVSQNDVTSLLGVASVDLLQEIAEKLKERDLAGLLNQVKELHEEGKDLKSFTKELIDYFHLIFLYKEVGDDDKSLGDVALQSEWFTTEEVMHYIESLIQALGEMKFSEDPRMILEVALIKMLKSEADISIEGILYRLSQVEKLLEKTPLTGETASIEVVQESEKKEQAEDEEKRKKKTKGNGGIGLDKVKRIWPLVLSKAKEEKISLYALLLDCRPIGVEDKVVELEIEKSSDFYLNEMKKPANHDFLIKILKESLGQNIKINYVFPKKKEAVKKIKKKPAKKVKSESLKDASEILKKDFGAEIIDESYLKEE